LSTPCSPFDFISTMSKHIHGPTSSRTCCPVFVIRHAGYPTDSCQGLPEVGRLPKEHDRKAYGGRGDKLHFVDRRVARCQKCVDFADRKKLCPCRDMNLVPSATWGKA
jgi:hypothetical protein